MARSRAGMVTDDKTFSVVILGRRLERIDFKCLSVKEKEQVRRQSIGGQRGESHGFTNR